MTTLTVETGVPVPMRDGVILEADVIRPAGQRAVPAVLFRTPYDRTTYAAISLQIHVLRMASAGYAVVVQDVRGRGGSGGAFEPFVNEQHDGVDSIHWVAEQPWCNGRVGTVGISYNAFNQTAAAVTAPEPLRAWIPGLGPFDIRSSWIRQGGALNYGFHLNWLSYLASGDPRTEHPGPLLAHYADPIGAAEPGPSGQPKLIASALGGVYTSWIDSADPYPGDPRVPGIGDLALVAAPALIVAGWFDVFQLGSLELYRSLLAEAPDVGQGLIVGPWDHSGLPLGRRAGDRDFGAGAMADLHAVQQSWFDSHLRDGDAPDPGPRVFQTGADEWENFESWPPETMNGAWALNPDGTLGADGPAGSTTIVVEQPTPAIGGHGYPWEPLLRPGSFDQSRYLQRSDVAAFVGDPLREPLEVAGPVHIETAISTRSGRSDIVATLYDVDPSGAAWNIADGVRRISAPPQEATPVSVHAGDVSHRFEAGHRIAVALAAAAFPRFDFYGGSGQRVFLTGPEHSRLVMGVRR